MTNLNKLQQLTIEHNVLRERIAELVEHRNRHHVSFIQSDAVDALDAKIEDLEAKAAVVADIITVMTAPPNHTQRVFNVLQEIVQEKPTLDGQRRVIKQLQDRVVSSIHNTRFAHTFSHEVVEPVLKAILTDAINEFTADLLEALGDE